MGEPTVRSFVAIELADPARSAVVEYLTALRATVGGIAWSRVDQIHLTLKFLGDVAEARIPALAERLRAVAAECPSFACRVGGIGAFPSVARPRVVWIGVEAPPIGPLAAAVDRACAAEGVAAEARPFHPHLTLGRVRERRRARGPMAEAPPALAFLAADGDREFGVSPATSLVLFRSELGAGGARHSALATLPLAG